MEKRLITAVTLSIFVILVYSMLQEKIAPRQKNTAIQTYPVQNKELKAIQSDALRPDITLNSPQHQSTVLVTLKTDRYNLDIMNMAGAIGNIKILGYKTQDIDIVNRAFGPAGILAIEGNSVLSEMSSQLFDIDAKTNNVYFENKDIKIEKNIEFLKDKYSFNASIKITNTSSVTQHVAYDLTIASNIARKEKDEARYIEAEVFSKGGKIKKIAGANLLQYNRLYKNDIVWLALKNKYYSIIAKPMFNPKGIFIKNIAGSPAIGFIIEDEKILPAETKSYNLNFYSGPMELKELAMVNNDYDKVLNFGLLTSISLVILSILQFFFSLFHNYGVAIVFLTSCISLLLYPLTFKSLKSMQKLQELQPHMEKIRQEHKDNPAKLNKEIMELYRRYNVNPMGGCLPMFLQMPIFIALYNALSRSVELKDAKFLWINDLSMPDALFHIKTNIPLIGNSINLLPILMIGAMILQQKTSQLKIAAAQSEQQKMMSNIMPVMFGVIFYSLPSGLVLYWLTNTLLTSVMQLILMAKIHTHET